MTSIKLSPKSCRSAVSQYQQAVGGHAFGQYAAETGPRSAATTVSETQSDLMSPLMKPKFRRHETTGQNKWAKYGPFGRSPLPHPRTTG